MFAFQVNNYMKLHDGLFNKFEEIKKLYIIYNNDLKSISLKSGYSIENVEATIKYLKLNDLTQARKNKRHQIKNAIFSLHELAEWNYFNGALLKSSKSLFTFILKELNERDRDNLKILDLGSGEGALSSFLHFHGYDVIAADIEPAWHVPKDIESIYVDLNSDFLYKFKTYDYIILNEVIPYVLNPYNLLSSLKKLLKPGGRILIAVNNITSFVSLTNLVSRGSFNNLPIETIANNPNPISTYPWYIYKRLAIELDYKVLTSAFLDPYSMITLRPFSNFLLSPIRIIFYFMMLLFKVNGFRNRQFILLIEKNEN